MSIDLSSLNQFIDKPLTRKIILGIGVIIISHMAARSIWLVTFGGEEAQTGYNSGNLSVLPIKAQGLDHSTNPHQGNIEARQLARQNLFGKVSEQPKIDLLSAPETSLNLNLQGVFLSPDKSQSSAMISANGGASKTYRVGEMIPGRVELAAVFSDRILIKRGGKLEALFFRKKFKILSPQAVPATAKSKPAQPKDKQATLLEKIEQLDDAGLDQYGITATSSGYQVTNLGAEHADVLKRVGLQSNDLIRSVNGKSLGGLAQDKAVLAEVIKNGGASVEIQRGNQRFTLRYEAPK